MLLSLFYKKWLYKENVNYSWSFDAINLLHWSNSTAYTFNSFSDCSCDPNGSVSEVCDDLGKCKCRDGFAGDTCNECAPGRTNFPECCAGIWPNH